MLHYAVCRKHQSPTCISGERYQKYNGALETSKLVFSNYTVRMRKVTLPFRSVRMPLRVLAEGTDTRCSIAATVSTAPHCVYRPQPARSSLCWGPADYRGDYWTVISRNDSLTQTENIKQSALRVLSVCNVRMLSGRVITHPHSLRNLVHAQPPHSQQASSPVLWTVIWITHLLSFTHSIQSFWFFFFAKLIEVMSHRVTNAHIYHKYSIL